MNKLCALEINFCLDFSLIKNGSWYNFTYHNQTDLLYILNLFKNQFEKKKQQDDRLYMGHFWIWKVGAWTWFVDSTLLPRLKCYDYAYMHGSRCSVVLFIWRVFVHVLFAIKK